eukprot:783421-Rhodomonas_salina.1
MTLTARVVNGVFTGTCSGYFRSEQLATDEAGEPKGGVFGHPQYPGTVHRHYPARHTPFVPAQAMSPFKGPLLPIVA